MSDAPRGRDQFARFKKMFRLLSSCYKILPLRMRINALERHRNMRGKLGIGLRYAILKSITDSIGDNVAIFPGVYIFNPENIVIGNNVSIQPMTYIECGYVKGGVTIDDDVSIAHGVTIMATTHRFDNHNEKIRDQGVDNEPVYIEENVWIGAKVAVLSGVRIGQGSVIGAGAVVNKSLEPEGVYVGVPAKRVKDR